MGFTPRNTKFIMEGDNPSFLFMKKTAKDLIKSLQKLKNPEKAKILSRFFKTGPGQYGEGDIFWGLVVPLQRQVAKEFSDLNLQEIASLLKSPVHEVRLTALFILCGQFKKGDEDLRERIYKLYLKNVANINNWDLVDLSAPNIVGIYLLDKDREVLYRLAQSKTLWERRISMLSCFSFIRQNDFGDAIKIAKILLSDKHDLMHKAVGWMLREVGKRDQKLLESFLDENISDMPRTTLRYAIEKFPENKRKIYLNKKII